MGKYFPPTSAEIHSIGIGFLDAHKKTGKEFEESLNDALNQFEDVNNERHYYRLGYAIRNQSKALILWFVSVIVTVILALSQLMQVF